MTAVGSLATLIADLSLERVPANVVAQVKSEILDALTTALAALETNAGEAAAHALDPIEGVGPARVIATGVMTSVNAATFVNTQMSVTLDLGSNLLFSQGLGGLSLFGALALAESRGASGTELLEAVIAGFEVAGRVALSLPPLYRVEGGRTVEGVRSGTRWVAFGAAAALARMRGLDAARIQHALVLAASSIPTRPSERRGGDQMPMAKYGVFGSIASSALAAVLLAERGFTGDLQYLDAQDGFHRAMDSECVDPTALSRPLGAPWLVELSGFKRYPSGTFNQQAIHTALRLLRDHGMVAGQVRSIRVGRAMGLSATFAKHAPANDVAAQFSLPFAIAAGSLGVPPRDWHGAVNDIRVREVASRVSLEMDAAAVDEFSDLPPVARYSPWSLRSHVRIESTVGSVDGWSEEWRVSHEEIEDKFRAYARGTLTDSIINRVIAVVRGLERLTDVRELTALFER